MSYIADLNKLEIDAYTLPELAGLIARIMPLLGADQAWRVLEASADRIMQDNNAVVYGVRRHPDNRNQIDEIGVYPASKTYEGWKNEVLPLMVASSFLMGNTLARSAKVIGLGPMSTVEHFQRRSVEHANLIGKRPDADGFPPIGPIAMPGE